MGRDVLFYLCIQLEVLYREVVVVSSIIEFGIWGEMYCCISVFYYGLLFRKDVVVYSINRFWYMGRHVLFYLCVQLEVLHREVVVVSSIIGFDLWDAMYCSISVFYYVVLFREIYV